MGFGLTVVRIGLGACGAAALGLVAPRMLASRTPAPAPAVAFSQEGRDAALVTLLHGAKRTFYLRTSEVNMTPLVNELGQLQQGGVQVTVDLPLAVGQDKRSAELCEFLMRTGAVVQFGAASSFSYEGTYALADGSRFLYSAAPLSYAPPGAPRSFVLGSLPSHG